MDSIIVSSTLENGGLDPMAPKRVIKRGVFFFLAGMGLGTLGGASATMAASWGKTVGAIVSSTLENGGAETTTPVCLAVRRKWGVFVGMGTGSLGAVSAMVAALWVKLVGAIVSRTLKNGGNETVVLVGLAVTRG